MVEFATLSDLSFVERWRETLDADPDPKQKDAVELAQLARERFFADSGVGQLYLTRAEDLHDHINRDQQCEVGGFILLRCDWFIPSRIIGLCHFRRTWCNSIAVDYLATHPLAMREAKDPKFRVKGIGTALLCFVSRMAVRNACEKIWGEATLSSHPFYEYLFELEKVKDLFIVPPENFSSCAKRTLDWQPQKDVNTMNMASVQELYDVEEKYSPQVGNRASVTGSKRQLVEHFLDLPRHIQDEVAKGLGLFQTEDVNFVEDQWCQVLFQRANEQGKLHELWNQIETRHENGEPEKNPFASG